MLAELAIDDLVLIAEARLELSPHLNVITGETGAGKSLLAQAIGLLLGDKADESLVRPGSERALVQAVFERGGGTKTKGAEGARSAAGGAGGTDADAAAVDRGAADAGASGPRELAVARHVPRAGRSRVYVDGVVSSAAAVEAALRDRVAFYGQLEHARLLQLDRQLDLLDAAAPETIGPLLGSYHEAYAAAQRLGHELEALRSRDRDRDRELDLLRFQVEELDAAALEPGEDTGLGRERERLRHAEKLLERVTGALRLLEAGDEGGAIDGLRVAERLVSEAAGHDAALGDVAGRLAALTSEAEDALGELHAYMEGLDLDPAHRDAVELRHDRLQTLKRKYRLESSEELIAYADDARDRLAALEGAVRDEGELAEAFDSACAGVVAAATELSAARAAAAPAFAAAVERELRALAMPHARFEVTLVSRGPRAGGIGAGERAVGAEEAAGPDEETGADGATASALGAAAGAAYAALGPRGAEEVEFLFSANPGVPPRPLRDTASGGELSRAMLAIRSTVTLGNDVETLIFDEVDTGIGGVTATALGERLARLAAATQIVCITHLPQLVAFADRHFAITKVTDVAAGSTQTVVQEVEGEERVAELCRMLGASPDDASARAHARALLDRTGERPPDHLPT